MKPKDTPESINLLKDTSESFNLLNEKWIPVLYGNGRTERVGILSALSNAGAIRQIAASNPMDRLALLRFLLALLYWCKGNPPGKISNDTFPTQWHEKLEVNKEYFNLLNNGKRFYQYIDNPSTYKKLSINYLYHEIPTGSNFQHFKHNTQEPTGLCPACCAMGLLRLPLFTTEGGSGKAPGLNGKPPIYTIQLGDSLASTLLLSWKNTTELGKPVWETPDLQNTVTGNISLLTGLTWLPRLVWLDDPEATKAICTSCGREEHLILKCVFKGKGPKQEVVWNDPHVIRKKDDVIMPTDPLGSSYVAADQWKIILTAILSEPKVEINGKMWVVSFATKKAKYFEALECEIPVTLPHAPDKFQTSVDLSDELNSKLTGWLQSVMPNPKQKHEELKHAITMQIPHIKTQIHDQLMRPKVQTEARTFLLKLYEPVVRQIIASLISGSPFRRLDIQNRALAKLNQEINKLVKQQQDAANGENSVDDTGKANHDLKQGGSK